MLLECLKIQMKCPELQKQALLTIHSICENKEDNVDLLREMGGVTFVYNLCKSSIVHSDVKETALFTLGTLAEDNVFCKSFLCTQETFADLAGWLLKEDVSLTQRRVSVYLLSVLVANNKSGQSLAQTSGCLDILLRLFRTTFPLSLDTTSVVVNATHTYQLWTSVANALCGCVNNPQNDEGQRMCAATFPIINAWLHIALSQKEILNLICSFIAMTVANNSWVQECFSHSGGLETLTLSLLRLAPEADTSLLSCQLSVTLSKTLSACITDNFALASGLARYGIVSKLLSLLTSPNLVPENKLSVLLALGHCTDSSVEHQFQFVQCGGLPIIITLLTEDTSEEVRKATTFILQTCKQATMSLGESRNEEDTKMEPLTNMESFRSSARELLHRIKLLEQKQYKEAVQEEPPTAMPAQALSSLPSALPLLLQHQERNKSTTYRGTSTHKHKEAKKEKDSLQNNMSWEEEAKSSERDERFSVREDARATVSSHVKSLEGSREPKTADRRMCTLPTSVRHSSPKDIHTKEELQDWDQNKGKKLTAEENPLPQSRCAGCVLPFDKVTSRTFASLQSSLRHSCDMHKTLQVATERFRTRHCSPMLRREYEGDGVSGRVSAAGGSSQKQRIEGVGKVRSSLAEIPWKKHHGFSLTPLRRGGSGTPFTTYNKTENRVERLLH
uniref:telomere repeats-binding bouquet formation protein 1 isoform X1 n=1 Tax=Solea senegalensis TaxID=28829 RepID=UPI001CD89C39|nr:telomere repeats-binding bouquet formation protein 1 isoform X1 [Solea senegalensis]